MPFDADKLCQSRISRTYYDLAIVSFINIHAPAPAALLKSTMPAGTDLANSWSTTLSPPPHYLTCAQHVMDPSCAGTPKRDRHHCMPWSIWIGSDDDSN